MEFTMSRSIRAGVAWLSGFIALTMFVYGRAVGDGSRWWNGAAVGIAAMVYATTIRRGRITCGPDGMWARNRLCEYRFPWQSILEVVPSDRIVVVTRDGRRHRLWTVQKSNLALMLERHSAVEEAVERIEAYRLEVAETIARDDWVVARRIAWPSLAESVLIATLGPGAYALGLLV